MIVIQFLLVIGSLFFMPILLQWLVNDSIIVLLNHLTPVINGIEYTFQFGEMSYWVAFLITWIVSSISVIFCSALKKNEVYTEPLEKVVALSTLMIAGTFMVAITVFITNCIFVI